MDEMPSMYRTRFKPGDVVEAQVQGYLFWFPGKIARRNARVVVDENRVRRNANEDDTYEIHFDDGDVDLQVPSSRIRYPAVREERQKQKKEILNFLSKSGELPLQAMLQKNSNVEAASSAAAQAQVASLANTNTTPTTPASSTANAVTAATTRGNTAPTGGPNAAGVALGTTTTTTTTTSPAALDPLGMGYSADSPSPSRARQRLDHARRAAALAQSSTMLSEARDAAAARHAAALEASQKMKGATTHAPSKYGAHQQQQQQQQGGAAQQTPPIREPGAGVELLSAPITDLKKSDAFIELVGWLVGVVGWLVCVCVCCGRRQHPHATKQRHQRRQPREITLFRHQQNNSHVLLGWVALNEIRFGTNISHQAAALVSAVC